MVNMQAADVAVTASGFSLATLTKTPPSSFIHITDGFHHALSGAVLTLPNAKTLAIVFYHANPFSEASRVNEVALLTAYLAQYSHAVVMGDFNALSPHDPYEERQTLAALQSHGITKFGEDRLTFAAISALETAGMVDAAHALGLPFTPTTPSAFNIDAMHAVPVRIDYAFVTSSLIPSLEDVFVVKDETTEHASDHYPVLLILKDIQ